jgi:hypothetical protein
MSEVGHPSKTPDGVVIGLAQLPSAVTARPDDLRLTQCAFLE